MKRGWVILAAAPLLAGCHHEDRSGGHASASGEILKGSVSDAMLPYDTVKSQAPAAPPEVPQPKAVAGSAASDVSDAADATSAADSAVSAVATPDSAQ